MNKKQARQHFKNLRKNSSQETLENHSKAIFDRTQAHFDLSGKKISIFLPIQRFSEINTWHFIDEIEASFYLPVIKGADELVHIKYESKAQIKVSEWGIPEPTFGDAILEKDLDFVLVPLLAFDEKGYRVGYGKGFYDRFLSQCQTNCQFIGLSYFDSIPKIDDLHENDISLHHCVTPNTVISF